MDINSIIEQAVEFGVKTMGGQKIALAIQMGAYWIEGWISGSGVDENTAVALRKAINEYRFV